MGYLTKLLDSNDVQMLIRLRTLLGGYKSAFVLFRFLLLLLKSHRSSTFFSISRQIRFHEARFWKVLRQINPYVSNKWSLKLPCAYLNTQESRHTGTPLKWNKDLFAIIMRYSFTFCTLVQYFVVLGNLIFLHFRSISNKLKKVVSLWFQIRFWKVLRQINPYVSNKWPLKFPCAYLNTQESRHTGTPLK
ncbi:hypothetical protein T01_15070 [Trichinella spiralis]|uniref:Uncharacterized protein n=1 Tax=Trichinella spiralis TaxID=6334 RepID=A0A0V1B724_TRISP|nr:hypothetical protein T01_15070 [Trichinella spiralis]